MSSNRVTTSVKTTVLFTACCGWPTCGTINSLVEGTDKYRVIGTDCSPVGAALSYVDAMYEVPPCTEDSYINWLISICIVEDVNVLVPLISDEIGVISANIDKFNEIGVKVLLSGKDSKLDIANDKLKLYKFLEKEGIDIMPKTIEIDGLDRAEIMYSLIELGWPYPVCIKAVDGCGAGGFRIIDDKKVDEITLNSARKYRESPYISTEQFFRSLPYTNSRLIAQEYLPGKELGTLCLVDHGRTLYSVSHANESMQNATATYCELVDDPEANEIVETINSLLNLDGNIGYDFKRDSDGHLRLLEINPRISATVSLAAKAGLNLVRLGVEHVLGHTIDTEIVPEYGIKLMRNYGTLYEKDGLPYV